MQRLMCILCLLYALSALGTLFSGCVNEDFAEEYQQRLDRDREIHIQEQLEEQAWQQQVLQEEPQAQQERFGDEQQFY